MYKNVLQILSDWRYKINLFCLNAELLLLATIKHQLGPQQLKYMTVRSDSSACLSFSLLADLKAVESAAVEKHLAWFEEEEEEQAEAESFKDLNVESPFDAWSLTTCITLIPAWQNNLLMYLKLIQNQIHTNFHKYARWIARLKSKPLWSSFNILRDWG